MIPSLPDIRDVRSEIDRVSSQTQRVDMAIERHVTECTEMRKAVDLKLNAIREDLRDNIKVAMEAHASLRKLVMWAAGIVIAVEMIGGRATVKALAQYFNIPLPGG